MPRPQGAKRAKRQASRQLSRTMSGGYRTALAMSRIQRPMNRYGDIVHSFTRVHDLYTNRTLNAANQTYGQFQSFTFADVPDFNQFAALFDWYRLDKIEYHVQPNGSETSIYTTLPATGFPITIHTAIDHGIRAAPTSAADLYQYTSYKCSRGMDEHVRVLTPMINQNFQEGGTTQFLEPKGSTWLSTQGGGTGVDHYGVLVFIDGTGLAATTNEYCVRIWARYYFSLKCQS